MKLEVWRVHYFPHQSHVTNIFLILRLKMGMQIPHFMHHGVFYALARNESHLRSNCHNRVMSTIERHLQG